MRKEMHLTSVLDVIDVQNVNITFVKCFGYNSDLFWLFFFCLMLFFFTDTD